MRIQIRIQLFTSIRLRNQGAKLMGIHAGPDSDPGQTLLSRKVGFWHFSILCLGNIIKKHTYVGIYKSNFEKLEITFFVIFVQSPYFWIRNTVIFDKEVCRIRGTLLLVILTGIRIRIWKNHVHYNMCCLEVTKIYLLLFTAALGYSLIQSWTFFWSVSIRIVTIPTVHPLSTVLLYCINYVDEKIISYSY